MLTTLWNQGSPYNDACPLQGSARTYTGCTATALAQVMKYHEWPAEQTTAIPAYTTPSAKIYVPELVPTTFRWSEMQDDYHYSDYATAVAELMRYCGQALYSDYTAHSTSASMADIPQVLHTYFGYDAGARHLYQAAYPISEWEALIYSELQAGRPVIHAGTSLEAGHAFVCDGYDGAGMFHFNWGWGGQGNGWFKLDAIKPYQGDDYSWKQNSEHYANFNLAPEGATAIDEVKGESTIDASQNGEGKTIYDLQGRKVETPSRGIYIVGGKKVLVN